MDFKKVVGVAIVPLVLLVAAFLVSAFRLWSSLGNYTFPWVCTAVAVAVLLVGVVSLLADCSPGSIPLIRVVLSWLGIMLILGIGMVVDYFSYPTVQDWMSAAGECVGFGVILAGAFWLPRTAKKSETA
ncbi:MAG: hypothetical protein ACYS9X_13100 [Planctomycetota bacterium]|jgi:hypothetical protein